MNRGLWLVCIFCFVTFLQSSCILLRKVKPHHKLAKHVSTPVLTTPTINTIVKADSVAGVDEKASLMQMLTAWWQKSPTYSSFTAKAKMRYEGQGQKQEFTALFRIKRNEVIWASVTALGGVVQVARVYITPDSLKLINYLNREVMLMSFKDAAKVLPVPADFVTLQNLVLGGALKTDGNAISAASLANFYSLEVADSNSVQQLNFLKSDSTLNTIQLRSVQTGGPSGSISFSDYLPFGERKFSMTRNISVVNAGEQHLLDINFIKADFDQPIDFPFTVPKNYTQK